MLASLCIVQEQHHTFESYAAFMEACVAPCSIELREGKSLGSGVLVELQALLAAMLGAVVHAPPLIVLQAKMLEAACPIAIAVPNAGVAIITKACRCSCTCRLAVQQVPYASAALSRGHFSMRWPSVSAKSASGSRNVSSGFGPGSSVIRWS